MGLSGAQFFAINISLLADLAYADATDLAELVRRKEVQPIELVDAAIERIERLNPALNVITPMYDLARAAARALLPEGPFRGVLQVYTQAVAEQKRAANGRRAFAFEGFKRS